MILFRQADPRFPFLWESSSQPEGRWHAAGEGPAHYLADTPDGAWAELLRHEEITDPADLDTVRRAIWAVEVPDSLATPVTLPRATACGNPATWPRCQRHARTRRARGAKRLVAPSAALLPGTAGGRRIDEGERSGPPRDGRTIVVFGPPTDLVGWRVADAAHPSPALLPLVRHYRRHEGSGRARRGPR